MNFGKLGVVVGFMVMGMLLTVLDIAAAEYLCFGKLEPFLLCFVAGTTFSPLAECWQSRPPPSSDRWR